MKIKITLLALSVLVISCGVLATGFGNNPNHLELPDLGPAPELENQVWINTDQPLRLAELQGKVVLLEMWTFG
jgi:hypothetical protein